MLPPRLESTRVRRRRSRRLWILIPLIALTGFLAHRYGETTYLAVKQRFLPENLQLLESRASHIQDQLLSHSQQTEQGIAPGYTPFSEEERDQVLTYLKDSRRILSFYEGSSDTGPALQAHAAIFQFYELLLYLQLNDRTLLDLAGRGFLPGINGIETERFRQKTRDAVILARKSIAMDPDQSAAAELRLIEILSDLLFNERTDPHLFEQLSIIDHTKVPTALQPAYSFVALALFARSGNTIHLNRLLAGTDPKVHPADETVQLLRIYALFHARDYIQAMQIARLLMFDARIDGKTRSEASRMIGEIYAIQSGPAAGLPFLLQARELRQEPDPFLEERIQLWQTGQRQP